MSTSVEPPSDLNHLLIKQEHNNEKEKHHLLLDAEGLQDEPVDAQEVDLDQIRSLEQHEQELDALIQIAKSIIDQQSQFITPTSSSSSSSSSSFWHPSHSEPSTPVPYLDHHPSNTNSDSDTQHHHLDRENENDSHHDSDSDENDFKHSVFHSPVKPTAIDTPDSHSRTSSLSYASTTSSSSVSSSSSASSSSSIGNNNNHEFSPHLSLKHAHQFARYSPSSPSSPISTISTSSSSSSKQCYEETIQHLNQENERLKTKHDQDIDIHNNLIFELDNAKAEIRQLKFALEQEISKGNRALQNCKDLEADIEKLKLTIERIRGELSEKEAEIREHNSKYHKLQVKYDELEVNASSIRHDLVHAQQKENDLKADRDSLVTDNSNLTESNFELKKELSELTYNAALSIETSTQQLQLMQRLCYAMVFLIVLLIFLLMADRSPGSPGFAFN